jgi:hypothetical protein
MRDSLTLKHGIEFRLLKWWFGSRMVVLNAEVKPNTGSEPLIYMQCDDHVHYSTFDGRGTAYHIQRAVHDGT